VGVILNLALWFALHLLFRRLDPWRGFGMQVDIPVWSSVDVAAAVLTAAAIVAIFRFRAPMLATLAGCALAGAVWFFVR
jgi:chromate transporter